MVWFALDDTRPLFAFAGIWTTFNGDRGTKSNGTGPAQRIWFPDDIAEREWQRQFDEPIETPDGAHLHTLKEAVTNVTLRGRPQAR